MNMGDSFGDAVTELIRKIIDFFRGKVKGEKEERDVLKGMVKAANSFKESPPCMPNSYLLQEENKRFEGITVFFSLKEIKEGTKKIRVVKKATWILFLFAGGFIPFLLGKWLARLVPRMD